MRLLVVHLVFATCVLFGGGMTVAALLCLCYEGSDWGSLLIAVFMACLALFGAWGLSDFWMGGLT